MSPLACDPPLVRRSCYWTLHNERRHSKLRGCDVVAIRVEDIAAGGYTADRATVRQKKTGRPVRFELSEQTRQAVDDYIKSTGKRPGEFLFTGRRGPGRSITTRQYARLVSEWIGSVGLDPRLFGTHSLRRTKATLIYRRTGNTRAERKCSALQPLLCANRRHRY
jgi:integrase